MRSLNYLLFGKINPSIIYLYSSGSQELLFSFDHLTPLYIFLRTISLISPMPSEFLGVGGYGKDAYREGHRKM